MSGRSEILRRLSSSLGGSLGSRRRVASARLSARRRGIVPARATAGGDLAAIFMSEARRAAASCEYISDMSAVVGAVASYGRAHNLPRRFRVSAQADIASLHWGSLSGWESVSAGDDDLLGVNRAYAGVAETGSLVFVSSRDLALSDNFLLSTHVAVLRASDIVASYEDIGDRLGDDFTAHRGLIFITGPSRTGDIAQTLELGAHGALRLHILIIDDRG